MIINYRLYVFNPPYNLNQTERVLFAAKTSKGRRTSDIISMLVNVYGSKDLFVNEYRTHLADRLLSQFTYNTEKEIRYLELLKIR